MHIDRIAVGTLSIAQLIDKGTTNAACGSFAAAETSTTTFDPNGNKVLEAQLNGPGGSARLTLTQTSYDALNHPICTAVRENSATFASPPISACLQSAGSAYGPDHL